METINKVELKDEAIYPDADVLKNVLGDAYSAYVDLLHIYDDNQMEPIWRYYHDGKAWLCKVQKKKKTIVWMSAWKGYMQAAIYMPEKFLDQVYALDISDTFKDKFRQARSMGKSRACIFEIHGSEVLEDFEKVMQLKILLK
ncbi:MAG: hypothetical protein CVU43_07930 [Chloroflexi bacterium HGW-Chloroflexi-5]|jgi:hypothetical protein|nr:MAG: hypothetical protein CVU43_07930 [Chloroflexi bacterium HGW-Chloroflexi-5]